MKIWTGKVISTKDKKTAIVEVERLFAHPLYGKRIRRAKRYPVHNETNETGVKKGDIVCFVETRPLSKTKRWKIVEVIKGGKVPNVPKVSKTKKRGENQHKSARKSAKNQRLANERIQG